MLGNMAGLSVEWMNGMSLVFFLLRCAYREFPPLPYPTLTLTCNDTSMALHQYFRRQIYSGSNDRVVDELLCVTL